MDPIQEERSLPSGQVVLGVPISPGFGGEMQEEYGEHVAKENAIDDEDRDLALEGQPTTPKARHSTVTSLRTLQTPRALLFQTTASGLSTPASPIHRPSFSSFDHSAFPSPPSASPGARSHRSSMTSFHPSMSPPLSPISPGDLRSRVSLDATPLMPPMELAPSPPRDGEEDTEQDDEEGTIHGSPTISVHTLRHPPRSVSTPILDETPAEPSFNFSFPRDVIRSASLEPGKAVDETIRSAEDVVGLGEGWSGGPRPRPGRLSWFSMRKTVGTADPLALWGEGTDGIGITRSMSASPLKQLWNRSKRNLLGESCPSLPQQRPITPVHQATKIHLSSPGERRRWSTLRPDATPSPPDSDPFRRHEPGITSSYSQPNPITRHIPSTSSFSPSSPHLPLRSNSQPDMSYSMSAFVRSEGDLHSLGGGQRGLPPPWRPRSMLIAGRQLSSAQDIPELDEDRPGASRAGTPTPQPKREESSQASEHSHRSGGSAAAVLTPIMRTETFGDGSSGEEDHGPGEEETHQAEVAQEKTGRSKMEQVRGEKNSARPSSPLSRGREAGTREKRASLFHHMRVMLFHRRETPEASKKRPDTPAAVRPGLGRRRTLRQTLYRRSRATLVGSPSTPALTSGADAQGHDEEPQSPFPRCRSPWLALQPSALVKRFSIFGEHHEHSHAHEREHEQEVEAGDTHTSNTHTRSTSRQSSHHTERTQRRHSISHTSPHCILSQSNISVESASDHLVRLSTADLSLDVHLEGAGLGLDDIIDEGKRSSYVAAMYTRGAMSLDDLTVMGRAETPSFAMAGLGISGWRGAQQRKDSTPRTSISGQGTTGRGGYWQACYAKSYDALTLGQPISATPFTPEPIAEYRHSGGSEAHSPVSTLALMTPAMQTPRELGTTLDSSTVLELEEDGGEETGEGEGRMGLGMSGTMAELVQNEREPRISVTSYSGSYQSLDDEVHAVEKHAIRVDSLVNIRHKASMMSSADVADRRRWAGLMV